MPVPNATLVQNITDDIAAKLQKALDGFASESKTKSVPSLFDRAAGGGSDFAAALGPDLLAADHYSYPGSLNVELTDLFNQTRWSSLAKDFVNYFLGVAGGSYSSFGAWVTDKSATIHPLAAELIRSRGGDVLGAGTTPVGVFSPQYAAAYADQILAGADGSLTDRTAALSGGAGAITLFGTNNHSVYIRCRAPFIRAVAGLATLASASITPTFFYWNGNSYASLTPTDNSAGFQNNDTLALTAPTDWEPNYKDAGGTVFPNAQERLYTLQIKRGNAAGITAPIATCLTVCQKPILRSVGPGTHLGVSQNTPLALLRIPSANTITPDILVAPDTLLWVPPAIRFRALTPFGANVTITVSYTNQAGANQTQAQGAWTSPAALATVNVTLNGSDTGVKALLGSGWTATASSSALGVIAVEVVPVRTPAV